ncbi:LPS export ABC transporter ATP-binding protein [Thiohalorhabdus sp.]|uniref:LPS export ABC transporter ATP-binding protein n=1 Tax=Thiohalorhabdus sp. TaxID=3094134 RepID=UPI002FC36F50
MSALQAENLSKHYRGKAVVSGVDLALEPGEIVGLLGPNGAGKTTSFYMIVGLIRPDSGQIHLDHSDITALPMYRRARLGIGYLPQEASVFRRLNVAENLLAILETLRLTRAQREERLEGLLQELGISHLRQQSGQSLSGGERRRVEIARALTTDPKYILLDEPFAGVDPLAVRDIQHIIHHLQGRGIGVLITDHNVRETLGICERAYILSEGSVLTSGEPGDIIGDERVRRVYLGDHFSL